MLNLIIEYFISLALTITLFLSIMLLTLFLGKILQRFRFESIYVGLYELKRIDKNLFVSDFLYESEQYNSDIKMSEFFKDIFKIVYEEKMMILILFFLSLFIHISILSLGLINVVLSMLFVFFVFFLFIIFKISEDVKINEELLRKQVIKFKEELKGKQ